jgi:iron complex transport system substrate-binding protein
MTRLDVLNLAALVAALALAAAGTVYLASPPGDRADARPEVEATAGPLRITLADGRPGVRDAQGGAVPLATYRRIASLGLESDALLAELCERDRLVAASAFHRGTVALRLAGLPRLAGLDDLEAVISLAPDLVLVSSAADQADRIARLRDAGLTVCDLGAQRGLTSLLPNAHLVGALIGAEERAARFVTTFTRRLARVAADLPPDRPRRSAIYLGIYGRELYGGTTGSSYHDVLTAAGLVDVAAAQHHGWPKLSLEEVLALDPELIVVSPSSAAALRTLPGAANLRALRDNGLIVLDEALLEDPGPGLLEAAEALFAAAYPAVPAP